MSVDVTSVPPWKQQLIERKRKQEEAEKRLRAEEAARLARMPAWKREIILKKQQQKSSLVYLNQQRNGGAESGIDNAGTEVEGKVQDNVSAASLPHADNNVNINNHVVEQLPQVDLVDHLVIASHEDDPEDKVPGPKLEHIIPITKNPWLLTDVRHHYKKKSKSSKNKAKGGESSVVNHDNLNVQTNVDNHNTSFEGTSQEDEVFETQGEEVKYGRGFVNKLLRKFKILSTKEDRAAANSSTAHKRSHSTENLLDEKKHTHSLPRSLSNSATVEKNGHYGNMYGSPKAHSMEDLLSDRPSYTPEEYKPHNLSISSASDSDRVSNSNDMSNHVGEENGQDNNTLDVAAPGALYRSPSSENIVEDELPKPNTVMAARSLFESQSTKKKKVPTATLR